MPRNPDRGARRPSRKETVEEVWSDADWRVVDGELRRAPGHPGKVKPLFLVVAEKLPFDSLSTVKQHMLDYGLSTFGIYLAHDSMGYARYAGRGNVFHRLRQRWRRQSDELMYYSFYIVKEKIHEREIETLVIRATGPLLQFNERKKRVGIEPGNMRDYEAGTMFYERRKRRRRG